MKLNSVSTIDIIPPYMQNDLSVIGLSAAADLIFQRLYERILQMDFFTKLELLTDQDLDYIADAQNIVWYDRQSTKDVKINVIKNAEKVFWYMGTVSAVESVMNDIFGESEIKEWFDYDGNPYHFKILSYDPDVTEEDVKSFLAAISRVKRKGAVFDNIEIALNADYKMTYGFKICSGDFITLTQEG